MDNLPLVSIVVPAYNVEPWLRECLDSILAQTYRNIEVVIVDDGSQKDSTPEICEEYASKDSRVKVVHKENGGPLKARESGVSVSNGEYIYFVDADDFVESDTIEELVALMADDIDLVAAEEDSDRAMTAEEYGNWLLQWNAIHVWGKLYRRSVVADAWVFDFDRKITVAEDFITNLRCLRNIKGKVRLSTNRKYHYRQLPESMVHKFVITSDYDLMIMEEATKVVSQTPLNLRCGFAAYRIGIVKHLICRKDAVDENLIKDIRKEAEGLRLTLYQRLVLRAASSGVCAFAVRFLEPFIKVVKKIRRTVRWA